MYLGDITPGTFKTPRIPYRELSSAPLHLVAQQNRMLDQRRRRRGERELVLERRAGLGDLEGFFSTSRKWRKRQALMMQDVKILQWWGYKFTREDEAYIRSVEFQAAKEAAKRSGMDRLVKDVAIPAFISIATAGTATPFVLGMAATTSAVNAVVMRKAEKQMISGAEKSFAINEDIIKTEGEVEDIQKEIAELQAQSGVSKAVVNKAIQDAANKQEQQKKALTTVLLGGAALTVAAMAA